MTVGGWGCTVMSMHDMVSPVTFAEALPKKSNVMLRHDMSTPVMFMHDCGSRVLMLACMGCV